MTLLNRFEKQGCIDNRCCQGQSRPGPLLQAETMSSPKSTSVQVRAYLGAITVNN